MKILAVQSNTTLSAEGMKAFADNVKVKDGILVLNGDCHYEEVEITPSKPVSITTFKPPFPITDFMSAFAAVPKNEGATKDTKEDAAEEPLLMIERKVTEAIGSYADLKVGDRFKFTDKKGRKHEVEVAAEEDNLIQVVWTHTVEDEPWNDEGGTEGGFLGSDIREYLNEEFYEDLPEGFKSQIQADVNSDYLRLLTKKEVFGVDGEKPSLKMFEDTHNRVAMDGYNGTCSDWWWLADVYSSADACYVADYGHSTDSVASAAFGVRPTCLLRKQ